MPQHWLRRDRLLLQRLQATSQPWQPSQRMGSSLPRPERCCRCRCCRCWTSSRHRLRHPPHARRAGGHLRLLSHLHRGVSWTSSPRRQTSCAAPSVAPAPVAAALPPGMAAGPCPSWPSASDEPSCPASWPSATHPAARPASLRSRASGRSPGRAFPTCPSPAPSRGSSLVPDLHPSLPGCIEGLHGRARSWATRDGADRGVGA